MKSQQLHNRLRRIRLSFFLLPVFVLAYATAGAQQMRGIYTINHSQTTSGRNFQTFGAAVTTLTTNGVDSHVVFNIASGAYPEPTITIPAIAGASDTSTITFQSTVNHADSVILNYAAPGNANAIIRLNNASHIHFKSITVSPSTSTGWGFEITGTASYNSIIQCKLSLLEYGIYTSLFGGHKNVFSGNIITGAVGILLQGNTNSLTDSNVIIGNTIHARASGLDVYYTNNTSVANNSIISIGTGFLDYIGIRNYYGSGQRFYHNTIAASGTESVYISYNNNQWSNNEWKNNIITNLGTGNAVRIINSGTNNTWEYNLYYTKGTNIFPDATTQNTALQDSHSVILNPGFASETDLFLQSACGKYGTPLATVTTDIKGNVRDTATPTMGAYEYLLIDNIAIDTLLQPTSPITAGTQDLVIRLKNVGNNPVGSFAISYVLNNNIPVTQQWSGDTLYPCDTASFTFADVNLLSENKLTIYTATPNGNSDTYQANDTLKTLLYSPLSGPYTIGHSGASFSSFNEAIAALISGGISGPVIFDVQSGIYTEQITIPPITGASLANTITFQSAANHADSVELNYAVTSLSPIIKLDNARHISFKYITVTSTTSSGVAFELTSTASFDSITHCKISAGTGGIYTTSLQLGKNVFSRNTITSSTGIALYGVSQTLTTDSNIITDNIIQASSYGLYLYYNSNTFIANNRIISSGNNGIYNNFGSGQRFYHNSIYASGTGGIYVIHNNAQWANNEWKNNIITHAGTGYAARIENTGTNNTWDYNLYYTNGINLFYNSPTAFEAWQATGQDSHSLVIKPDFISETDLHLTSGCKSGIPLTAVTTDIEGNLRDTPPNIGAYEYLGIDNIAIDALVQPTLLTTTGMQDLMVRIKNTGTNTVYSFTVNYELNNGSPVSQHWAGTLPPCDTVSVTFWGVNILNKSELIVYTTLPNYNNDTYTGNDTLKKSLHVALSGSYTIGHSGADFTSFSEAVDSLILGGVYGPVVFDVQPGTYTLASTLTIPVITGSSATNTVTFRSSVNHAESVILNLAAGNNIPIIMLNNANYIHFKHITVESLNPTTGRGFQLTGTASYNSITYCKINTRNNGIYANPLAGGKNVFSHNTITATTGINLQGISTALTDSNVITGNTIISNTGTTYGLDIYYNSNTFITGNSISSNNVGIRSYYCSGLRFYHNSINAVNQAIYVSYNAVQWSNNEWRNNIIMSRGVNATNSNATRITNTGTNNTWDYNLYHSNGTRLFYDATSQNASMQLGHSLVYRPAFTSDTNLQPNPAASTSWVINGRAVFLDTTFATLLSIDANGNPRPLRREDGVPDLGAYEFTPTAKPPLATAIGSIAVDNIQIFIEPYWGDTVAQIKWDSGSALPEKVEVRQYVGVPPPGVTVSDKFTYFYTTIQDSGFGGYNFDADIYYKKAWLGTVPSESSLTLIRHDNNNGWVPLLYISPSVVTDSIQNTIKAQSLSNFGIFTGTDLSNPLPVELLSFKANVIKNDVLLTWSTASEMNASHFVVERLVSGNQWSVIVKVEAKGNSSSINNYQFTDNGQLLTNNQLYYRLKIVDNDGSYEYSKVVSVSREQHATQSLSVYPNPFNKNVNVVFVSTVDGIANINIVDITGRDVQLNISKQIIKGNNVLTIDTDKLNKGIYFLSVEVNGEKQIVKLVKQ